MHIKLSTAAVEWRCAKWRFTWQCWRVWQLTSDQLLNQHLSVYMLPVAAE